MYDTLIFDLDGVLYKNNIPIQYATVAIREARKNGMKLGFFTNASVKTRAGVKSKLKLMNIKVAENEIITSSYAIVQHFKKKLITNKTILIIGEKALSIEFEKSDNHIVTLDRNEKNFKKVDYLVMGYYENFSYDTLVIAQQAILDGATFYTTDMDKLYPHMSGLFYPSIGWQIAAIKNVTGISPLFVGKPNPFMIEYLLSKLGSIPENTLVIGDNLWTDILAGINANCSTCFVHTGINNEHMEAIIGDVKKPKPDYSIPNLSFLKEITYNRGE